MSIDTYQEAIDLLSDVLGAEDGWLNTEEGRNNGLWWIININDRFRKTAVILEVS